MSQYLYQTVTLAICTPVPSCSSLQEVLFILFWTEVLSLSSAFFLTSIFLSSSSFGRTVVHTQSFHNDSQSPVSLIWEANRQYRYVGLFKTFQFLLVYVLDGEYVVDLSVCLSHFSNLKCFLCMNFLRKIQFWGPISGNLCKCLSLFLLPFFLYKYQNFFSSSSHQLLV